MYDGKNFENGAERRSVCIIQLLRIREQHTCVGMQCASTDLWAFHLASPAQWVLASS